MSKSADAVTRLEAEVALDITALNSLPDTTADDTALAARIDAVTTTLSGARAKLTQPAA